MNNITRGRGRDKQRRKRRSKWTCSSGWNQPEKQFNYGVSDVEIWKAILKDWRVK